MHSADYNFKIPLSYFPRELSPLLILTECLPGVRMKDFAFSPKGAALTKSIQSQPFVLTTGAMRVQILKQKACPLRALSVLGYVIDLCACCRLLYYRLIDCNCGGSSAVFFAATSIS